MLKRRNKSGPGLAPGLLFQKKEKVENLYTQKIVNAIDVFDDHFINAKGLYLQTFNNSLTLIGNALLRKGRPISMKDRQNRIGLRSSDSGGMN